ncbi:acetyl-CoA hydrolase/transferase C-terminal domain-containing protein [[Clostridium] symbiosum]|uniref:acetyl-CoA hydrolase/transferase family protein n=1 Tax=Clostridium symbiosum TaxID=1512 RepID=UPI001D0655FB|nr:acetyl-CoA hydrolase/transferase C-terminal domain-containing protein [[Clostridium] symbiosum]MCB6607920.1 hypothetical protein [[Clostridium] symbiosum]MCB6930421.1 hypothetical protein [[Clostridium] symbiosum]
MALWQDLYKEKTITAQQAADMIKNGDRIMTGNRDCRAVLRKVMERRDLQNVYYYAPIINFMMEAENLGKGFRPSTSFLNGSSHQYFYEDRLDYIPGEYWLYEKIASEGLNCNVAFLEVTKPDEHGYVSMGTCTDFIRQACKNAELVIAETNTEFPFIHGSNVIHISELDYIVDEGENYPLLVVPVDNDGENAEVYQSIGGYLSELIPDEATIEVGLGRLNAASLMYLENKHNLGVHTEVYGDILMRLTEKGIITNTRKSDRPGKAVFTQMVGTPELFDWSDHNLGLEINCCQDVLNPGTIYRQNKMTAINNAVEIDLMGQANAEFLKGKQYSGLGGLCNFASGAAANLEGKSIVVLESATRNGKYSKITPSFKPGTPVSLPRTAIEYVVTEQGVAKLVGKTPPQRTRELIRIAHPKFREKLTFEAQRLGLI